VLDLIDIVLVPYSSGSYFVLERPTL